MHNPEASPLRGKANGARRPSDGTRRNRAMQLKLSEGELEQLRALADQRGLSIQRFLADVDGARRAITDAMRSIEDFIDGMQRRR
jgi:predicted metal-dependent enzyme (double-stranded beta helix superfamily)